MKYLFDTNIFIRSKNEMPADIWPTFWSRMAELMLGGKIFTSEKVKDEINRGKDDLTVWMKDNTTQGFYIPVDTNVIGKYSEVLNWANSSGVFKPEAVSEFAKVADSYLVATAAANGLTLVTYETSDPTCRRRVKIPDACVALGVVYCDLNAALREMGVTI